METTKIEIRIASGNETFVETADGEPLGNDRYRLRSLLGLAYGLSWGDVVQTEPSEDGGDPVVIGLVKKSGHRLLRVRLEPPFDTSAECKRLLKKLAVLDCMLEQNAAEFVRVGIPPLVPLKKVADLLDEYVAELSWEYADPMEDPAIEASKEKIQRALDRFGACDNDDFGSRLDLADDIATDAHELADLCAEYDLFDDAKHFYELSIKFERVAAEYRFAEDQKLLAESDLNIEEFEKEVNRLIQEEGDDDSEIEHQFTFGEKEEPDVFLQEYGLVKALAKLGEFEEADFLATKLIVHLASEEEEIVADDDVESLDLTTAELLCERAFCRFQLNDPDSARKMLSDAVTATRPKLAYHSKHFNVAGQMEETLYQLESFYRAINEEENAEAARRERLEVIVDYALDIDR